MVSPNSVSILSFKYQYIHSILLIYIRRALSHANLCIWFLEAQRRKADDDSPPKRKLVIIPRTNREIGDDLKNIENIMEMSSDPANAPKRSNKYTTKKKLQFQSFVLTTLFLRLLHTQRKVQDVILHCTYTSRGPGPLLHRLAWRAKTKLSNRLTAVWLYEAILLGIRVNKSWK